MEAVYLLFLLRLVFIAILIIFTSLIFPAFNPGAKYHILFEAALSALCIQLIRRLVAQKMAYREKGLTCGVGIVVAFIIINFLFKSVNFTLVGILFLYLGVVLLEMLLPNELSKQVC